MPPPKYQPSCRRANELSNQSNQVPWYRRKQQASTKKPYHVPMPMCDVTLVVPGDKSENVYSMILQ